MRSSKPRGIDLVEARELVDRGPIFDKTREEDPPDDARWLAACKALGIYPGTVPFQPDWRAEWVHRLGEPRAYVKRERTDLDRVQAPTGSLQHYPAIGSVEWKPNHIFEAILRVTGYARGRSAAYFYMQDIEGVVYPMFLTFAATMLEQLQCWRGWVRGEWTFAKRGQNYSLVLYRPGPGWFPLERPMTHATCNYAPCEKTTEIDEPTGMPLESGWLRDGRGDKSVYYCSTQDRMAYLRDREAEATRGV